MLSPTAFLPWWQTEIYMGQSGPKAALPKFGVQRVSTFLHVARHSYLLPTSLNLNPLHTYHWTFPLPMSWQGQPTTIAGPLLLLSPGAPGTIVPVVPKGKRVPWSSVFEFRSQVHTHTYKYEPVHTIHRKVSLAYLIVHTSIYRNVLVCTGMHCNEICLKYMYTIQMTVLNWCIGFWE